MLQCCGRQQDTAVYDLVKNISDKLEEMERVASADIYDNIYGGDGAASVAQTPTGYPRRAASMRSDRIYSSVSGR